MKFMVFTGDFNAFQIVPEASRGILMPSRAFSGASGELQGISVDYRTLHGGFPRVFRGFLKLSGSLKGLYRGFKAFQRVQGA